MKIFETFECSGQNLSNSICQSWNDKLIPLQILYRSSVSWKITPLYFFSLNKIYFAQKELIKMKICETFKCSGQNLSNSSCQLWNKKSVPLLSFGEEAHTFLSLDWRIPSKSQFWVLRKTFVIFLMSFSKPQVSWKQC